MTDQRGLDLTQLDAVTADLDLRVLAAEELDVAVRQVAAEVAGAVEALARPRMRDEARRRLFRIAPVALGEADAADVELPRHPGGPRPKVGVEHVEGLVRQRPAVGNAAGSRGQVALGDGMVDRPDRALGGAAEAHQLDVRGDVGEGADAGRQRHRNPVARHQDQAQGSGPAGHVGGPLCRLLSEHLHQRRHRIPHRHALRLDARRPVVGIAALGGLGEDDRAPRRQGAEDVVDREVERQRGERQHAVLRPDAEAVVHVEDGVDRTAMVDHHALGMAGRAGGEDDVGEILGMLDGSERLRVFGSFCLFGLDPQALDSGRPFPGFVDAVVDPGLSDGELHLAVLQQVVAAVRRQVGIDGQVGGAGPQDAEGSDHLLPALLHHHCHQGVGPRSQLPQAAAQGNGTGDDLAVGERAPGRRHGDAVISRSDEGVEELPRRRAEGLLGVVDGDALGPLRRRQQLGDGGPPGFFLGSQSLQQLPVGLEHGFDQSRREEAVDHVPVVDQPPALLHHLVVDPHLGSLADDVTLVAQAALGRLVLAAGSVVVGPGEAQGTGEDDGHEGPRQAALRAGELAQHPHAADVAMVEVLPELGLSPPGALLEGPRHSGVDRQQGERGEVADDVVDLWVKRQAVEQREVDGETRALAPRPQDLGKGGHQDARGRQAGAARTLLEAAPDGAWQAGGVAHEVGPAERPGALGERQLGRRRQVGEPAAPVVQGALEDRRALELLRRDDIVAERQLQRRHRGLRIGVEAGKVAGEDLPAPGVADQEVVADVEAAALVVEPGGAHLEKGPAVARQDLVRHLAPDAFQTGGLLLGALAAQVEDLQVVGRHGLQDLLPAVGLHDGPQHVVAVDQTLPGPLRAGEIDAAGVELHVDMGGDLPQLEGAGAADPIGLLHVGEGERLMAVSAVRHGPQQRRLFPGRLPPDCHGLAVTGHGGGKPGHGRRCEQILERRVGREDRAHLGGDLGGQQRVAAELEEVVVGADSRDAERPLPDARHLPLARGVVSAGPATAASPGSAEEIASGRTTAARRTGSSQ